MGNGRDNKKRADKVVMTEALRRDLANHVAAIASTLLERKESDEEMLDTIINARRQLRATESAMYQLMLKEDASLIARITKQ